jgi:hypothetical protein
MSAKKSALEDLILGGEKSFTIKEASIKDDYCNYTFEITKGVGAGDTHSVKGSGIIEEDMRDAFRAFNVHLAAIDDVFKLSGIEIEDIEKFHNHELTANYHVNAFKIKGGSENESIILIGSKFVGTAGGRIELATPKIPLDNMSSYQWYNELKAAADKAREEVALYKEGKYTTAEEEEEPNPRQLTIGDAIAQSLEDDNEFENAKV